MASITTRKLDDSLMAKLRVRAAHHGRSMEEEAREILQSVLLRSSAQKVSLVKSIRAYLAPFGGVDLPEAKREPARLSRARLKPVARLALLCGSGMGRNFGVSEA